MKKAFILGFLFAINATADVEVQAQGSTTDCTIDLFTSDPMQVSPGGSAILNWKTSNCSNVTIIGGNLSGYRPTSGNLETGPLAATTTFTLTAASPTSTASRDITLTVQQITAPPTSSIPPPPPPPPPPPVVVQTPVEPAVTSQPVSNTTTTISTPPAAAPATTTTVVTTSPTTTTRVYDGDPRPAINVNRLRFGAYLAPTISWMKPTASTDDENKFNVENGGSKIGFTYGLMADYFFAPNYGIVTGIQINQTGGKIIATNRDQTLSPNKVMKAEFDYRLQYVEIPLALKLRTDEFSGFRFFGQLGASIGFNIGKKADYAVRSTGQGGTAYDTSGTKIKLTGSLGHIAPIMFQMNIGAGLEYPISNRLSAYLGLFFNNGFAPDATKPNLFDEEKLGYKGDFRDANTRLNNFALRLGLFF